MLASSDLTYVEYTSIIWNPHLKGEIAALENVQKYALRVSLKSWASELLVAAKLPCLQTRRIQASLCHFFTWLNLTDFLDVPIHLQDFHYNIRSAGLAVLRVPKFRSCSYQFFFIPNVISIWNELPNERSWNNNSFSYFKRFVSSNFPV